MDLYDIGDKPTFTATFTTAAGTPTDPTAVVFQYRVPSGVETSYTFGVASEVAKSSVGVYTFTPATITAAGTYSVRAKGTGALVAAVETAIEVRTSAFVNP